MRQLLLLLLLLPIGAMAQEGAKLEVSVSGQADKSIKFSDTYYGPRINTLYLDLSSVTNSIDAVSGELCFIIKSSATPLTPPPSSHERPVGYSLLI